jgi:hypothetical protein
MEARIAALEAELRKAQSFADPDLFNQLQLANKQRASLAAECSELRERVAETEELMQKTRRSAAANATEAAESSAKQIESLKAALGKARNKAVMEQGKRLALAQSSRAEQLAVMRLREQVARLEATDAAKQARLDQLQRLLTDVFAPTDRLMQSMESVRQKQMQLQERLQLVGTEAMASDAERARVEAELERERVGHNAEVERLKSTYEVGLACCSSPEHQHRVAVLSYPVAAAGPPFIILTVFSLAGPRAGTVQPTNPPTRPRTHPPASNRHASATCTPRCGPTRRWPPPSRACGTRSPSRPPTPPKRPLLLPPPPPRPPRSQQTTTLVSCAARASTPRCTRWRSA